MKQVSSHGTEAIVVFGGKYLSSTAKVRKLLEYDDLPERVRQLSAQNLMLLMQDIGLSDTMFLFEQATAEQMQGVFDLTLWDGEQLLHDRFVSWMRYARAVSVPTLHKLLRAMDPEILISFILSSAVVIPQPDKEEEITHDGEFIYSPDRLFLLIAPESDEAASERAQALRELVQALYDVDLDWARELLTSVQTDLPSQAEARSLHFREARLTDMGFYPFDEAIAMYHVAPIEGLIVQIDEEIQEVLRATGDPGDTFVDALVPRTADTLLNEVLLGLEPGLRQRFFMHLTYLVNRSLVARKRPLDEIDVVGPEIRWVMGHLNLGLAIIAETGRLAPADVLSRSTLLRLFQVAVSRLAGLRQRATALLHELRVDAGYALFEEELTHALVALATPFPARYRAKGNEAFSSQAEVSEAERMLAECEEIVAFFRRRLGFDWNQLEAATQLADDDKRYLTFTQLLATLIVHYQTGDGILVGPVSASQVRKFAASSLVDGAPSHALRQRIGHELIPGLIESTATAGAPWLEAQLSRAYGYLETHLGQLDLSSPLDPSVLPIGFLSAEE